jgi:hypothetical protein
MLPFTIPKPFPPYLFGGARTQEDPGENGRRIENFIGENEHLSQIIGGDPFIVKT